MWLDLMTPVIRYHGTCDQISWHLWPDIMAPVTRSHGTCDQISWHLWSDLMAPVIKYHGTCDQISWHLWSDIMAPVIRYHGTCDQNSWHLWGVRPCYSLCNAQPTQCPTQVHYGKRDGTDTLSKITLRLVDRPKNVVHITPDWAYVLFRGHDAVGCCSQVIG